MKTQFGLRLVMTLLLAAALVAACSDIHATGGQGGAGAGGGGAGGVAGGGASDWLTPPMMPPALVAPAGAVVKIHAHAVGAQIYTCTASTGADGTTPAYAFALKAPDATLYDQSGVQIGTHGAGPSWTSTDGSVANGAKVAELPSPSPDAIAWLLLRVSSATGPGSFSDISYVQRLATTGGKPPATGCDATAVGAEIRSEYAAEYFLYAGGGGAAWLEVPTGLPAAIAAPSSASLKLHDRAIGMQIYGCRTIDPGDGAPATYAWIPKVGNATLFDLTYVPVGREDAGPSWTASDESTLEARELAQVDSPRGDAIPWTLLQGLSSTGPGDLGDVTIVQRLNTAGGKAPTGGCDATVVDTVTRVPFSADYYFFR